MSFTSKLASRIPVLVIGIGLILATGSFRGHEGSFGAQPMLGGGLVVVGIALWGGLRYYRS